MEIVKSFTFDAAHFLPTMGEGHKYAKVHGHSFRVEVTLEGEPDAAKGWVVDFAQVTDALEGLRARLDHHLLNEIDGLEVPTLENLARWIADELKTAFPGLKFVRVERPSIGEACRLAV